MVYIQGVHENVWKKVACLFIIYYFGLFIKTNYLNKVYHMECIFDKMALYFECRINFRLFFWRFSNTLIYFAR